jgi:hypothetical protein
MLSPSSISEMRVDDSIDAIWGDPAALKDVSSEPATPKGA